MDHLGPNTWQASLSLSLSLSLSFSCVLAFSPFLSRTKPVHRPLLATDRHMPTHGEEELPKVACRESH